MINDVQWCPCSERHRTNQPMHPSTPLKIKNLQIYATIFVCNCTFVHNQTASSDASGRGEPYGGKLGQAAPQLCLSSNPYMLVRAQLRAVLSKRMNKITKIVSMPRITSNLHSNLHIKLTKIATSF